MRRTTKSFVLVAAVVALLLSNWGTGVSGAWPPEDGRPDPGSLPGPGNPGEQRSEVRYGPYSLDPAPENPDGTHGHAHSGNQFAFNVEKPCSDCYITGMQADLVDQNGNTVGIRDNVSLHHMVLFNQNDGRTDATCNWGLPVPLGALFGQRFFASGDERTPIMAPEGYGYYVGNGSFNLIWELMSMSDVRETAYFEVTFDWVPASEAGDMVDIEPVWFDLFQCGTSTVSVPAGESSQSWTWNANRTGDIVGIGGHVHDGGVNIDITNETTGDQVCDSVAGYGEHPLYINHHGEGTISSMSTCGGWDDPDFRSPVSSGDRVTITANYDMPEADDGQMGIVVAYLAKEDQQECSWWEQLFGWC